MAKSVTVAMQDLNCQCYVDNMTTLTLSPICMVSGSPL